MPAVPLSLLWLVPALPLVGFVVNGTLALARPTAKRAVSIVGVGTLVLAFAAAAIAVAGLARHHATAPLECRSEEHTSELQSHSDLVCRLLLEKKKTHSI